MVGDDGIKKPVEFLKKREIVLAYVLIKFGEIVALLNFILDFVIISEVAVVIDDLSVFGAWGYEHLRNVLGQSLHFCQYCTSSCY